MARRAIEIREVLDRWLAPEHRYFRVRGADAATYVLRHDTASGRWEVVTYEPGGPGLR